eukprot:1621888-Prymnesium_polylepis.2
MRPGAVWGATRTLRCLWHEVRVEDVTGNGRPDGGHRSGVISQMGLKYFTTTWAKQLQRRLGTSREGICCVTVKNLAPDTECLQGCVRGSSSPGRLAPPSSVHLPAVPTIDRKRFER